MGTTQHEMLRSIPPPQYACTTCGECFDDKDLHWHPLKTKPGRYGGDKIVVYEGWHCYLCEPSIPPHERVTLNQLVR